MGQFIRPKHSAVDAGFPVWDTSNNPLESVDLKAQISIINPILQNGTLRHREGLSGQQQSQHQNPGLLSPSPVHYPLGHIAPGLLIVGGALDSAGAELHGSGSSPSHAVLLTWTRPRAADGHSVIPSPFPSGLLHTAGFVKLGAGL